MYEIEFIKRKHSSKISYPTRLIYGLQESISAQQVE